jgi:hypothetical protein
LRVYFVFKFETRQFHFNLCVISRVSEEQGEVLMGGPGDESPVGGMCAGASSTAGASNYYQQQQQQQQQQGGCSSGGGGGGGGSPYRVQRHAANVRERKRMLRSAPTLGPKDTVKM